MITIYSYYTCMYDDFESSIVDMKFNHGENCSKEGNIYIKKDVTHVSLCFVVSFCISIQFSIRSVDIQIYYIKVTYGPFLNTILLMHTAVNISNTSISHIIIVLNHSIISMYNIWFSDSQFYDHYLYIKMMIHSFCSVYEWTTLHCMYCYQMISFSPCVLYIQSKLVLSKFKGLCRIVQYKRTSSMYK